MLPFARVPLSAALTVVLAGFASGAPVTFPPVLLIPPPVARNGAETWEPTAREHDLTAAEIKLLREQKFLVTGNAVRQVFRPYTSSDVPVFITSDSILNAYHVLLEESIYRTELANSRKLPGVLERVAKNLDVSAASLTGNDALAKHAKTRAAIFLGVARNLLDDKVLPDDAGVRDEVQTEVKRVVAGTGAQKPAWLGPPDSGFVALDYTRFRPRGFYTRTPALQRYFRAVAWLQAVPFRLDRNEEFVAFVLMRRAYFGMKPNVDTDQSIWDSFRVFIGERDDWDLPSAWKQPKDLTKAELGWMREWYQGSGASGKSQINDLLRFAPTEAGAKPEVAFRFLSAHRLPDAVMFSRTVPGPETRDFPSGLDVAAALGAPSARDTFKKERPKLLAEIDASRSLFKGDSLYADYLRCLGALLERTEPDAPEFMKSEPWRIKTTQTALAGWAQMRHTWALQAKQSEMYLSSVRTEAGFVEPVPEFYGRLAALLDATAEHLRSAGAFEGEAARRAVELRDDIRDARHAVQRAIDQKVGLGALTPDERVLVSRFTAKLEWPRPATNREAAKALEDARDELDELEVRA